MAYPKITWTAGGVVNTLQFTYPPTQVAAFNRVPVAHQNVASGGAVEVIVERIDNFLELTMATVLAGADVTAWDTFMQYALEGNAFNYYPDASQSAFTQYVLDLPQTWLPAFRSVGLYKFKLKFRAVVT